MTAIAADAASARVDQRVRRIFAVASAMLAAFLVSLFVRSTGSYSTLLDGWGVSLFELSVSAVCAARYFDKRWRSSSSAAKAFPLVLGAACASWALGDVAMTIESLGG